MQIILGFIILVLSMSTPARADIVHLFAAGSLKGAFSDIANFFEGATGNKVEAKYGASGLLKNEISQGVNADVFASANMEHLQALHDEKKSGPVILFARNKLCALVKPGLAVTRRINPETLTKKRSSFEVSDQTDQTSLPGSSHMREEQNFTFFPPG